MSRSNDLKTRLYASITKENSLSEQVPGLTKSRGEAQPRADKADARATRRESVPGSHREKFNMLAANVENLMRWQGFRQGGSPFLGAAPGGHAAGADSGFEDCVMNFLGAKD